jgi:hypothetical protein
VPFLPNFAFAVVAPKNAVSTLANP